MGSLEEQGSIMLLFINMLVCIKWKLLNKDFINLKKNQSILYLNSYRQTHIIVQHFLHIYFLFCYIFTLCDEKNIYITKSAGNLFNWNRNPISCRHLSVVSALDQLVCIGLKHGQLRPFNPDGSRFKTHRLHSLNFWEITSLIVTL